jgi:hypothetical protein
MFRHLVVTRRSRVALYLARIPAGLAIVGTAGRVRVQHRLRRVHVRRAQLASFNGVTVPSGLSQSGLENWAADHPQEVLCDLPYDNININVPCGLTGEGSGGARQHPGRDRRTDAGRGPPGLPAAVL